jgi:predicted HAD superfamily Cof-like phosphohydrolase
MTDFEAVGEFNFKFKLPVADETTTPSMISDETFLYRLQHLHEELQELCKAHRSRDLVGVADALADLVYIALGTAHFYHLPFDAVFAEVQRANMEKERATSAQDERSKRASAFDIVKPVGWAPPDLKKVLQKAGIKTWK